MLIPRHPDCPLLPSRKEAVEHVLRELDDIDVPGLRRLDAGHLRLLPAPQLRAIEQVALGTAVQERLKYSQVKQDEVLIGSDCLTLTLMV